MDNLKKFLLFGLSLFLLTNFLFSKNVVKIGVILNNVGDTYQEFNAIKKYLNDIGYYNVNKIIEPYSGVKYSTIKNLDFLIVDDMGYFANSSRLEPTTIDSIYSFYKTGKPIYFIGDDMACNIVHNNILSEMIKLNKCSSNGVESLNKQVKITNFDNPIINGKYGNVDSFVYYQDLDHSTLTSSKYLDNVILTIDNKYPVMLYFVNKFNGKIVVQIPNVFATNAIISNSEGLKQLEILFKNSVDWLLSKEECNNKEIYNKGFNDGFEKGKQYCKNNPEKCGIDCYSPTPPVPNNCEATFDFFDNTLHVPCFRGKKSYWLDFQLINSNPVQLELKNFGENK